MAVNQPAFDRYSSAHAGFGATFATIGIPWWGALAISVGFEAFENRLKDAYPEAFPFSSHDSIANTIGDTAALMAGWGLARHALDGGLAPAESSALAAAIGATVVGFLGAVVGGTAGARGGEIGEQASNWGDNGYRIGSAIGGGGGARDVPGKVLAAAGGATAGPVGAALAAYVTAQLSDYE